MGLLDSVIGSLGQGGSDGRGGGGNAALLSAVIGMLAQGMQGGGAQHGGGAGGGGLGGVLGGLLGGASGGGGGGLGNLQGGLGELMGRMQQGGLGDVMNSWVSTGENQPISPDQLGGVLGADRVSNMASQLGMERGDLLGQLSQLLPQVVDKATPQGRLPTAEDGAEGLGGLQDLAASLGGSLFRR